MRATAMPSLPEMPMRQADDTQSMQLKILYSLDNNNFLARTPNHYQIRTARVVLPGQSNIITLGVIPIKQAIFPIINASPELFEDFSADYSIYVKDVSEEDEPFVGHGLVSKFVNDRANNNDILIPGRVCSSFASFLGNGGGKETLEIKVKLVRVKRVNSQQQQQQQQQQPIGQMIPQETRPLQVVNKVPEPTRMTTKVSMSRRTSNATQQPSSGYKRPRNKSDDDVFALPQQPLQIQPNVRKLNTAPAQRAVRTQSLPVFDLPFANNMNPKGSIQNYPPESIARRIHMADKQNSLARSNPNYEPVQSRFTNFQKSEVSLQQISQHQLPPTATFLHPSSSTNESKQQKETKQNQTSCCNPNCNARGEDSWHYYQDKEGGGGIETLCNQCFIFMREKGGMRPKGKTIQLKKKRQRRVTNTLNSDPPSNVPSSSPPPVLTPVDDKKQLTQQHELNNVFIDGSDPLNEFDHIINNSDLDFQIGPLTDIDPLPTKSNNNINNKKTTNFEDQENFKPIQLKKYTEQTNFEKMLARSFSGYPTSSISPSALMNNAVVSNSPNNWTMPDIFEDIDAVKSSVTPANTLIVDTPRDAATCTTIPIESPDKTSPPETTVTQHTIVKKRTITRTFASSPFREQDTEVAFSNSESSPNESLMADGQKNNRVEIWSSAGDSDFTKLSSEDDTNINKTSSKFLLKNDSEGNAAFL